MDTQIDLLKKYNLPIRGVLGQHLLIDPNIQRKIVDLLEVQPSETILEIGPGLGALTREILNRGAKVFAVEKDERFIGILREEFKNAPEGSLEIFHGDILEFDFKKQLSPKTAKAAPLKVVSNLPYYITAPILFHLAESRDLFSKAVLTMQKEVAERLIASPGTKDYGRLTLGVRYVADVKHAFNIPPGCFAPRPAVKSSVVVLKFHPLNDPKNSKDEKFLFGLIRLAFSQRRKTLLSLLCHDPVTGKERKDLLAIFQELNFLPTVRGEELLLKDYLALAEKLSPPKP